MSYQLSCNGNIFQGTSKGYGPFCFDVWEHLCVAIDTVTGMFTAVKKGHLPWVEVVEVFKTAVASNLKA